MGDRRDEQTWVTLELTPFGEQKVEEGTIEDDILDALGAPFHWPIFIPARTYVRDGKTVTVHLYEGYAFVGTGLDESRYFALECGSSRLVKQVMSVDTADGLRVLHTIKNHFIEEWKTKLREEVSSDIGVGMKVRITEGKLLGLVGEVKEVDGDEADVLIQLRSAHVIIRQPRCFLEPYQD